MCVCWFWFRNKYVRNTKKTQEVAGISFSEIKIYRIICRAKVGKNPENPRFSWLLVRMWLGMSLF
jgi:hypothetical protein